MGEDPWATREQDFWSIGDGHARSRFVINYAVLAPSALNTQPWLFTAGERHIDLYADRRRGLAVSDPEDRQLTISCGAALAFLTVAMKRFGRVPIVHTFPNLSNPDHLATIKWGGIHEPVPATLRIFEAMKHRNLQVGTLSGKTPSEILMEDVLDDLDRPGIRIERLTDLQERARVGELIFEARRVQEADGSFRRERENWSHPDRRHSRDGWPETPPRNGRAVAGKAGLVGEQEYRQSLAAGGPELLVVASKGDSRASWLESGRTMAHLMLRGAANGLSTQFVNAPLELPTYREKVDLGRTEGWRSQSILRMGYAKVERRSLRRPVQEVLMSIF